LHTICYHGDKQLISYSTAEVRQQDPRTPIEPRPK
jgi:hypothetical protein